MGEVQEQIIKCAKGDRIILPFPGSTPMTREGDDLIIHSHDAARTLRLAGFYRVARTVKLIMDGEEIDALEFFALMGAADLLPAADEGHGEDDTQLTARGHIWDVMGVLAGLDHLEGLDISFSSEIYSQYWNSPLINEYNFSKSSFTLSRVGNDTPNIPDAGNSSGITDIPSTPDNSGNPDTPNSGDPSEPPPGDTPGTPDEPEPVVPDPPEPPKPWPENMPPPVWIRIVDEGNYSIKINKLESVMADEKKAYDIDEPLYPDFTSENSGISAQADGDSRPTYETTNPNLPTRFGVSFELAEGYHVIEVVEQGLHGHVEQEGEDGDWFYYLDEAIKHEPGAGTNLAAQGDTVVLLVGDAYGNEWEIEVPVAIRDDVPEMSLGNKQEFQLVAGHEEHAAGMIFNFGADDADGKKLEITVGEGENAQTTTVTDTSQVITVTGQYGTLTINPDGTYSYHANAYAPGSEGGTDTFNFTITDADGDTVTADINGKSNLQFTVEMPEAPELSSRIDEREGVIEGKPSTIEVPEGFHIISGGTGAHGSISQVDGSWVYTLNEALNHGGADDGKNVLEPGDTVKVTVGDEYGNVFEVDVPVAVVDDVPKITMADDLTVNSGESASSTGKINFDFGADNGDGKHLFVTVDGKETELNIGQDNTITGSHGTLTMKADGSYSYEAKPITYDADNNEIAATLGDTAVANVTFSGWDTSGITDPDALADIQTIEIRNKSSVVDLGNDRYLVLDGYRTDFSPDLHFSYDPESGWTLVSYFAENGGETPFNWIAGSNGGTYPTVEQNAGGFELYDYDGYNRLRITGKVVDGAGQPAELTFPVEGAADLKLSGYGWGNGNSQEFDVYINGVKSDTASQIMDDNTNCWQGGQLTVKIDLGDGNIISGTWTGTEDPDADDIQFVYSSIAEIGSAFPGDKFAFKIVDADGDVATVDADGNPYELTVTVNRPEAPELSVEIGEHEALIEGQTAAVVIPDGYHIISGGDGQDRYNPGGPSIGSISQVDGEWVYTLNFPLDHPAEGQDKLEPGDTVTVIVGDDKGNTWQVEVPVTVIDDIPVAEAQTGETSEGATDAVTGTVIGEHTAGADGLDRVQWGKDDATADVTVGTEIKGLYGTLTANPDGTWSYSVDNDNSTVIELKVGETLEDIFDFKVFDYDGDSSAQQLTITINGVDNDVDITPSNPDPTLPGDPDVPVDADDVTTQGASELVFDKDLIGEDASLLTKSGTMAIDAPDGMKSLAFGELVIPLDGTEKTIDTAEGTLTVSYAETDAKTGTLNYSFTLKTPGSHEGEGITETIIRDFEFTVTDTDGTTGKSTIRVKIGDDEPKAEDDGATIAEGTETVLTSEHSVLENDYRGADGSTIGTEANPVVWTAQNQYGTFTGKADGTWSYTLDNTNADVIRLKEGETLEETVTYKIKDADGDESEATLTITITGTDSGVTVTPTDPDPEIPGDPDVPADPDDPATQGAKLVFKDHDLLGDDQTALTKSGTMDVSAPDGVAKITVGTTELALDGTESTITLPEGTLTLSYTANGEKQGVINYSFAFTTPGDHPVDDPVKDELLTNDLRITVTDTDGSEAKSTLHIDIEDDTPTLSLGEDLAVLTGRDVVATGKMAFGWGADNGDGKKLTISIDGKETPVEVTDLTQPITVEGTLGTLTIKADGTYSYVAKPAKAGENGGTEKFTFSIQDADGDVVDANDAGEPYTLTVTVTKPDTPEVVLPEVDEALDRVGALQVSEGNLAEGVEIVLPAGYTISKVTAQGKLGTITQDEDGKWIYRLNESQDSGDVQGENTVAGADTFRIAVVREADGKVTRLKMSVDVIDDVPEISPEGAIIDAGETATGTFNLDFGADNGEGKSIAVIFDGTEHQIAGETEIAGNHGTLIVQADGTYSYTANADASGTDVFTVKVKDADGDTVERPLEIAVASVEMPEMVVDTTAARSPLMAPAGYRIMSVAQAPARGTIDQDADGNWFFEPDGDMTGVKDVSFSLRFVSDDGGIVVRFFTLPVRNMSAVIKPNPGDETPGWEYGQPESYEVMESKKTSFTNVLEKNFDGFTFQEVVTQGKYGHVLENGNLFQTKGDYILDKPVVGGDVDGSGAKVTDEVVLRYVSDATGKTYDRTVSIQIVDDTPYLGEIGCHESKHVAGESSTVNIPDGYTILEVIQPGTKGDLTKDGDTWSYRLNADVVADEGNMYGLAESADIITVKVRGPEGTEFTTKLKVVVMDDVENATYDKSEDNYGTPNKSDTGSDNKEETDSNDTGGSASDKPETDKTDTSESEAGKEDGDDVVIDGDQGGIIGDNTSNDNAVNDNTVDDAAAPAPMSLLDSMIQESETMSLTTLLDPDADVQASCGYGMQGETVTGQLSVAIRDSDVLSVMTEDGYVDVLDALDLETQTGALTLYPDGSWSYEAKTAGTETLKLKVTDIDGQEKAFDFTLESLAPTSVADAASYDQASAVADIPAFDDAGSGVVADAYDDLAAIAMQQQAENQG